MPRSGPLPDAEALCEHVRRALSPQGGEDLLGLPVPGPPEGESPHAYLMRRRIEHAMALRRRGDLSVTELCSAVGCSSLGTFTSRFTEWSACRPAPTGAERRSGAERGVPRLAFLSALKWQTTLPSLA
ncbi:hypothetical protein C3488_33560 [Streptomyces sp. Ru72]|nr:hypothetical protein C3488_33560 [Streptomyces sp. Ru72]